LNKLLAALVAVAFAFGSVGAFAAAHAGAAPDGKKDEMKKDAKKDGKKDEAKKDGKKDEVKK
jgi:ribosomal protein L12E/L44/L45/RPP1/RPP2